MLVIGITGPTGCGKTTLLREIEHRGGYIVDCDALYYALLASEEGAELQTAFPAAFDADGRLRRKALGQLVFGDQARMAQLNEIVFFHIGNAVRARLVREQAAGRRLLMSIATNAALIMTSLAEPGWTLTPRMRNTAAAALKF